MECSNDAPTTERERPSPWVVRFAPLVPTSGRVIDLACGAGRHTRHFLANGYDVLAVDRDVSGLDDLRGDDRCEIVRCDVEQADRLPFAHRAFAGVIVTNYLYRPILGDLIALVAPGGVLIYETFASGNERFGRPSRPEYLLRPNELLDAVLDELRVLAFEDLIVDEPRPAARQRIVARRDVRASVTSGQEPALA